MTVQGEGSYHETLLPAELTGSASAWKSVPGFVRVAVWIWSLATVLSVIFSVLVGLLFVLGAVGG